MSMTPLTVHREFAADNINAVVAHPDVRPWVGGTGPLDLTSVVADPNNVLLMGEGGGLLFQCLAPGLYEVHTQFIPEARGPRALQAVKDALRWMFTKTDCIEVVTKVPDGNVAAYALVRAIKGTCQFHRPNAWLGPNGLTGVRYYSMTLAEWVRNADGLEERGHWFHQQLEAAKTESNAAPLHDDDNAHDRYVGATCEMVLGGQIAKALDFYRRWAIFAGYIPAQLIAVNPPVIDIGDAILAVKDGGFDVLLCR